MEAWRTATPDLPSRCLGRIEAPGGAATNSGHTWNGLTQVGSDEGLVVVGVRTLAEEEDGRKVVAWVGCFAA